MVVDDLAEVLGLEGSCAAILLVVPDDQPDDGAEYSSPVAQRR
jgi:hypothetical protein